MNEEDPQREFRRLAGLSEARSRSIYSSPPDRDALRAKIAKDAPPDEGLDLIAEVEKAGKAFLATASKLETWYAKARAAGLDDVSPDALHLIRYLQASDDGGQRQGPVRALAYLDFHAKQAKQALGAVKNDLKLTSK